MRDSHFKIALIFTLVAIVLGFLLTAVAAHAATAVQVQNGGTGTTTGPGYGQVLIGGKNGEYEYIATSTFGGPGGGGGAVNSVFGRSGNVTAQTGDYTTSQVTEGSNLYYTLLRFASGLAGTTTDALAEGVNNLYFTNGRALAQFVANLAATSSVKSITTLPSLSLPYSQVTGTPSSLPTSTLLGDSNTFSGSNKFTNAPVLGSLTGFVKAASGALSTALISLTADVTGTLGIGNGGTGSSTPLGGILKGNGNSAIQSAVPGTDYQAPITLTTTGSSGAATFSNNTLNIPNYTFVDTSFSTTSANYWASLSLAFSTTSVDYWKTQRNFFSTTSADYHLAATTSVKSITTLPGLSLPYSQLTSAPTNVSQFTNDAGYVTSSFSTTSATYWSSLGLGFSTTSSTYWSSLGLGFSTTSANYWGSTKGYLTSAVTSVGATYPIQSSGGNTPTISFNGLGTTSPFLPGQLAEVSNGNTLFGVSTTTASCTGNATCSAFTIVGTSPVTINVAAGTAASSTLLGDANTFSGVNKFTNSSSDFSGTWQTFSPSHFDTFAYPFINSATSSALTFLGGLVSNGSTTIPGVGSGLVGANNGLLYGISTSSLNASITGNAGTATALATGRTISITGDLAYTAPSFDGSGNVTAAGTLATVNGNVGTFTYPSVTVNGKGLITAISNGTAPTTYTGTFPIQVSGSVISNLFSTTSNSGMAQGNLYVGSSGVFQTAASSSIFGFTPVNPSRTINTTAPLQGGGDLSADRTFSITQAGGAGDGYLASTDWLTFNSKVATGTKFVSGNLPYWGANGTLFNVPTTTASCSGNASCSAFTILGSTPVTISVAAGTAASSTLLGDANTFSGTDKFSNAITVASLSGLIAGNSGLLYGTGTSTLQGGGLVNVTAGSSVIGPSTVTVSLNSISANTVLGNNTGNSSSPTAFATSSLFGTGTGGQVLTWNNGVPAWVGTTTNSCSSGITCSFAGSTWSFSIGNGAISNAMLANSAISGVALGGTLNSLSHDSTLTGTSYNGSATVSNLGIDLTHANNWTGLQQFLANASTTQLSVFNSLYVGTNNTATSTIQGSTIGTSTLQGFLNVAGANSTSTFSGGLTATYLNLTGSSATSTAANGVNLTAGCFSVRGTCVTGGGGSGTVTSVALTVPTGMAVSGSPVTGNGTLGVTLNTGFSIKELPSWVVAASGGDFTTIQAALDACGVSGGGNIVLTDPTYAQGSTGLLFKGSNCHLLGRGVGTSTISFSGAISYFKTNSAASVYSNDSIDGITISGDGNVSSVVFDLSDMSHFGLHYTSSDNFGTWLHINDTQNVTFYDDIQHNQATTIQVFGINASSTNPTNDIWYQDNFIGCSANNCIGVQFTNANGNNFRGNHIEPSLTATGVVGIKIFDNTLASCNGVFNNIFDGNYIESGNTTGSVGISVAKATCPNGGIQRNRFSNNTDENNKLDYAFPGGATSTVIALQTWDNNYDSNFGNPLTSFQGPFGVGTSSEMESISQTPFAFFGVSPQPGVALNEFVVGSSTATHFLINNSGFIGLGTTSPWGLFSINPAGSLGNAPALVIGSSTKTLFSVFGNGRISVASATPSALWGFTVATSTNFFTQFGGAIASSTSQASSYTVNWESGNTQRFILNQATNIVINATSSYPHDGFKYVLILCQDPTGGRSATFVTPGQLVWTQYGTTSVNQTANTATLIGMVYDGRTQRYDVLASSTPSDTRACLP